MRQPGAVLFVCSENALRSPMAEGLLKRKAGGRIYVDSVGLRAGALDPVAVAVMAEIGIDISRHRAKMLADLNDASFDVVICLTPEAEIAVQIAFRSAAAEILSWPIADPSLTEGNREMHLLAYRALRDELEARLDDAFPSAAGPRPEFP